MSGGRALLLTERAEPGPRLVFALRWAHALGHAAAPLLVSLGDGAGERPGILAAAGVHHRRLDPPPAGTAEGALRGLCRAFGVSDLLLWDSPRALALVPALRDLPHRPRVSAHLAPSAAVAWDETVSVAVRGRNAVDHHLVEDEETAAALAAFELGSTVRWAALPQAPPPAPPPPAESWAVVEDATWRRGRAAAAALVTRIEATGALAAPRPFAALLGDLFEGRPPARVAFPEPDLPSAAPVLALTEAGARVHVAEGAVERRLLAAGLARPLAEVVA